MKNKINLGALTVLTLLTMAFAGCSFSVGTNTSNTPAKPANAAPANTASNTSSPSNAAPANKPDSGKKVENEKRPEGKTNKAKDIPVPANWDFIYDENKGYSFYVPEGSTMEETTENGVTTLAIKTPSEIGVVTLAFKDKTLTKEDLLDAAAKILEAQGTVTKGNLKGESDNYSIADATIAGKDKKAKARILVATDVTDNYIMIIITEESKFAANEKIIDEIWGNFEMWSGKS